MAVTFQAPTLKAERVQRHADIYKELNYQPESWMREIRQSGSEE